MPSAADVKYCTSDLWSGDAPASDDTYGFTFRGSRVVAAVINALVSEQGMGSTPGARLLFGGCSAGAIGAMNNLEAVSRLVPPTVQVNGFLDGAALLDIQPRGWTWSSELETLQSLMHNMSQFTNPVFEPYCAQQFGKDALWKCWIGQYRLPLITSVPYFINAPQFDMFNVMYDTDNYLPSSPSQVSFVEEFQAGILSLIGSLPSGTGVFSPTCLVHCLSGQTTFTELTSAGTTLDAALTAWYFTGDDVLAVSDCIGWGCTRSCGVDLSTGLPCNMGTSGCTPITVMVTDPGATTSTDQVGASDTGDVPQEMAKVQQASQEEQQRFVAQQEPALSEAQQAQLSALLLASHTSTEQAREQAAQQLAQEQAQEEQQAEQEEQQEEQAEQQAAQRASQASRRMLRAAGPCCGAAQDDA